MKRKIFMVEGSPITIYDAAEKYGVNYVTLVARMRKLGIKAGMDLTPALEVEERRHYRYKGEIATIQEIADDAGISYHTLAKYIGQEKPENKADIDYIVELVKECHRPKYMYFGTMCSTSEVALKLQISRKRLSTIIKKLGIKEGEDVTRLKGFSSRFGVYIYNGKVMSAPMIARETGHTNHTIYKRLKAYGCEYGDDVTEICNEQRLNIRKYAYNGEMLTINELAEEIDRTSKYVCTTLRKYGVEAGEDVTGILVPGPLYPYYVYKGVRASAYRIHWLSGVSYKKLLTALKSKNVKMGANITRLVNSLRK